MGYHSDKVWTLGQLFKTEGGNPFEYDQGDTVRVHYDELYNLYQKAYPATGQSEKGQ